MSVLEGSDGYKYEWTLISHPEGDDETGTMEDQNTKNLKLSKVKKSYLPYLVMFLLKSLLCFYNNKHLLTLK